MGTTIREIEIESAKYPGKLKEIRDPPKKLFCLGTEDEGIFTKCLAVVGSRNMSSYGRDVVKHILKGIVPGKLTIVSGFMYGIDHEAHYYALEYGLRTIAVLPCGPDVIHPAEQKDLYQRILANNGLILSEYPPGFEPKRWTFVKRNRIVAGMSAAVLVIEAPKKSGALITAGNAKSFGRKVFTVPGNIFDPRSAGCNDLVKNGAELLDDPEIVNRFYELDLELFNRNLSQDPRGSDVDLYQKLYSILKEGPFTIDNISVMTGEKIEIISTAITGLIIEDKARKIKGGYIAC